MGIDIMQSQLRIKPLRPRTVRIHPGLHLVRRPCDAVDPMCTSNKVSFRKEFVVPHVLEEFWPAASATVAPGCIMYLSRRNSLGKQNRSAGRHAS